jgi:hypothetical protein
VIHWLISELNPQSPVFWLMINVVVTTGLGVAHWRTRAPWLLWVWIAQWILVPYLGLLAGGLSPRLMGLAYLDWPATFGLGFGLIFVILALLVAVRASIALSDRTPYGNGTENAAKITTENVATAARLPSWQGVLWVIFLGGAEEFHWVFLRGAMWEILLTAPVSVETPAYWAIWAAAAFVVFETALRRPPFEQWLIQITVLVATSIVFLYTRNFWLCWILHATALLLLNSSDSALPAYPELTATSPKGHSQAPASRPNQE